MARDNNGSTPFEDVDAADDFVGPLSRISTRETALASIFNEVQLFERYGQIERALEQLERSSRLCQATLRPSRRKTSQKQGSRISPSIQ